MCFLMASVDLLLDAIRYFRHAVSLGERRVRYAQNLWQTKSKGPEWNTPDVPSNRLNDLLKIHGLAVIDVPHAGMHTDRKEMYFLG